MIKIDFLAFMLVNSLDRHEQKGVCAYVWGERYIKISADIEIVLYNKGKQRRYIVYQSAHPRKLI